VKLKNPFQFFKDLATAYHDFKTNKKATDDFIRNRRIIQGHLAKKVILERIKDAPNIRDARIRRSKRSSKYRARRWNVSVGTITDLSFFDSPTELTKPWRVEVEEEVYHSSLVNGFHFAPAK